MDPNATLNLDISAMIAYVSDVSNGHTDRELFLDKLLLQMAIEEGVRPVLPTLLAAMEVTFLFLPSPFLLSCPSRYILV
jgi:hypothetical protein